MTRESDSVALARRRASAPRGEQPAVSYLVRFWMEPRESEGASSPFRGYARDLRTGEERYFSDPRRFAEHVLRSLRPAGQEQPWENEADEVRGAAG